MDNIILKKTAEDKEINWMYLDVECLSNLVKAKVSCMTSDEEINDNIKKIEAYLLNLGKCEVIICFGLGVNPRIEIKVLEINRNGRLKLEIDMDIDDSNSDRHKCSFFVETEFGLLAQFKEKLKLILGCEIGESVSLL